ncbi:50S ribosomal protein L25/general stress protein Ctc [Porticoccus sp. W117]|uniref:50S ribosomal protein L25/general stress protein Ctc n=1 Tax=Porticoccus sp. W117 TaxID=3054777 RepID=UPI002595C6CF|nr:50S ribosomal protein L25/general stress protein Ctc [Porticoccus sp. W117]MDM3871528.1 50S ribosomal protein L25/general stress protein Ctc [Porticoccus sp. W117]
MSDDFTLSVKVRQDVGKGASRRQRRLAGEIPGIVYGGVREPVMISIPHKDIAKALENEAFYSHVITLDIDGTEQPAILKDLQRHPAKALVLHADFLRVNPKRALTVNVPLHFVNEDSCIGVKQEGGVIAHTMTELEITCLPADLPEYLEVDMAEVTLGQSLHISDIKLPEGVESVALSHGEDHDLPIAAVNKPKAAAEEEADEDVDAADVPTVGDEATDDGEEAASEE